ncbi:MAG: right-handed parallel beta-helix repeat-containing protein [Planctomycetota bacterium]
MKLSFCLALGMLCLAAPALGAEFEVSDATGLTDALVVALTNGEDNVILLAAGTYKGNFVYRTNDDRSITIRGADGTTRDGVVLDGGGTGRVLDLYASPRNATREYGIEVRGLTVRNGDSTPEGHRQGGGIAVSAAQGTIAIIDCVVQKCVAHQYGGGIYLTNSQDTRVERCLIQDNAVSAFFTDPGRGGGLALSSPGGTHVVVGCVVVGNSAEDEGGGLWIGFQKSGTRNIVSNTIHGNDAPVGGGIYFYAAITANVMNNIVTDNTPEKGGQIWFRDGYVTNRVGHMNNVATVIGGWTDEDGNVDTDPGFVNAAERNFHLFGLSRMRDAGRNDAPGQIHFDHEGNPRIADGNGDGEPIVDIGAFELYRPPLVTIGSELVLAGAGFGEKKPKVYLLYEKKPGKLKAAKLKVLEFTDGRLECLFKKKMAPGTYPLFCQPKGRGMTPIPLGSLMVVEPVIGEARPKEGPPGTLVTLQGDWFGSKKPKVWLKDPGSFLRRKLKVKRLEFYPAESHGEIDFIVPKLPPGKYVLQLANKIGEDESSYVVTD